MHSAVRDAEELSRNNARTRKKTISPPPHIQVDTNTRFKLSLASIAPNVRSERQFLVGSTFPGCPLNIISAYRQNRPKRSQSSNFIIKQYFPPLPRPSPPPSYQHFTTSPTHHLPTARHHPHLALNCNIKLSNPIVK